MRQPNELPNVAVIVAQAAHAGAREMRDTYEAAAFEYVRDALASVAQWIRDNRETTRRQAYGLACAAQALCDAPRGEHMSDALAHSRGIALAVQALCDCELELARRHAARTSRSLRAA